MSDDLIRRAREALVDVTPGPWEVERNKHSFEWVDVAGPSVKVGGPTWAIGMDANDKVSRLADARFIAAARDLVPAMADRLEAQDALLREVWGALDAAAEALDWALAEISEYANIMSRDPGAVVGIAATAADEARATLAKLRAHMGETE